MENSVLLVDDESHVLSALNRSLFREPVDVVTAPGGEEALEIMAGRRFKVVISDERMIGMRGSEFLFRVKELYPDTVRMMLTGYATLEAAQKAVNEVEIYRFFTKPWNDHDLKFAIRSAIEKFDLEIENRRLLALVEQQCREIRLLERYYPGISRVEKDETGNVILPEISDDELSRVLSEYEREAYS